MPAGSPPAAISPPSWGCAAPAVDRWQAAPGRHQRGRQQPLAQPGSWPAPARRSAMPGRAPGTLRPGCWDCPPASRASSRPWRWPTRRPAPRGPWRRAAEPTGDRLRRPPPEPRVGTAGARGPGRETVAGRSDERGNQARSKALRGRLSVRDPFAQPIRASGRCAAPTGRTHDRNRTEHHDPVKAPLAPKGPSTQERGRSRPRPTPEPANTGAGHSLLRRSARRRAAPAGPTPSPVARRMGIRPNAT